MVWHVHFTASRNEAAFSRGKEMEHGNEIKTGNATRRPEGTGIPFYRDGDCTSAVLGLRSWLFVVRQGRQEQIEQRGNIFQNSGCVQGRAEEWRIEGGGPCRSIGAREDRSR